MPKISVPCTWCNSYVERYPSQMMKNTYCSSACRGKHLSKKHNPTGYRKHPHLSELNLELNPKRMRPTTRWALRKSRLGKGEGKSYEKTFGQHTHRIVAEEKLGRKLLPGEVVHHIDGNKRNNSPENLMVFSSQTEHLKWHRENDERYRGGGAK